MPDPTDAEPKVLLDYETGPEMEISGIALEYHCCSDWNCE